MEERSRYVVGDLVVPVDLPRTFVCSVARTIGAGADQLLELTPLGGPWPHGTRLVRLDEMVRRAHPTELGPAERASRRRDPVRGGRPRPILVVSAPEERETRSFRARRRPEHGGR